MTDSMSKWFIEKDHSISFSVTSDGMTGDGWVMWLESNGFFLSRRTPSGAMDAKEILLSREFKPTCGVTTQVLVLKTELFEFYCTAQKVCLEATRRTLRKPSIEVSCLIRKKFTDADLMNMGLESMIIMHEPVMDSEDHPRQLMVDGFHGSNSLLSVIFSDGQMFGGHGFAFEVSRTESE